MNGRYRWIQGALGAALVVTAVLGVRGALFAQDRPAQQQVPISTSKMLLMPVPGEIWRTNTFPTTAAISPDGRFIAILNNGNGDIAAGFRQSISILDLQTGQLADFPDSRLELFAHQTYFLGLAFSADGRTLYASMDSLTDPIGAMPHDTGDGIAVYHFDGGRVSSDRFISIPLQPLGPKQITNISSKLPAGKSISYPAGLAVLTQDGHERLLVADNLSDDALLIDAASGAIVHRFDLSTNAVVPASYPYAVVVSRDNKRAWVSLWNGSEVDELDLESGSVTRKISLLPPASPTGAGSHPTALLLSPDEGRLYVTLANADRVAVVDTASGNVTALLSTELPGEKLNGTYPGALALRGDRLYVADASSNAVAVFDVSHLAQGTDPVAALGFIPTEWYPTALLVRQSDLFVVTGKGKGTGPNSEPLEFSPGQGIPVRYNYPYIPALMLGSIARVDLQDAESHLASLTQDALASNRMLNTIPTMHFASGSNPIHHVIYIIRENRGYDEMFGDIKEANGDPSLVMFGESVSPNAHALARQFGVLDNFYVSAETSANGHIWSTAAISTDYTERTWQIGYRGSERLYDFAGVVSNGMPMQEGIPDVDDPSTGYIWGDIARAGLTYRHYGEFVPSEWCNDFGGARFSGDPVVKGKVCPKTYIMPGQPLPLNVGQPHGSKSPYHWPIPILAQDVATKPELVGHFDPRYADFNLLYPDQLRADEFLNEFAGFVQAQKQGRTSAEMPQFVMLRLPNDHTVGALANAPRPESMVADNDLAVGRVVEAISHSAYWNDTAIFIVEDDAQDGPDHVDAHRSPALVISKYSRVGVDHNFYTTVSLIRTMEELLGLPPMNNNDAWATPMTEFFSGPATQAPFNTDRRNLTNGLIYQTNSPYGPGAPASAHLDFSRADMADAHVLNRILWRERKGNVPMPASKHTVFPAGPESRDRD